MTGEIIVKVKPDTKELDKELKKPRTFSGLLGFGREEKKVEGGIIKELKQQLKELNKSIESATTKAEIVGLQKEKKGVEKELGEAEGKDDPSKKTNQLLGGILKSVGAIAILGTLLSGLTKIIEPFVKLFAAISALLFFPLVKLFLPLIKELSAFIKDFAAEGGGIGGFLAAIIGENEDEIATDFIGLGALLTGLFIAAFSSGLVGMPLLISAAILLNVNTIADSMIESLGTFWASVLAAVLVSVPLIILAAMGGWIVALLALLLAAAIVFFPQLKKFGKFIWDKLIFFTTDSLLLLIRYGSWLWEQIKNIVSRGLDVLANIGQFILDKIKSFFSFGGGSSIEGKASGGPVTSGTPFLVGERGPELFVPNSNGNIVPNGVGGVTQYISIQATINNDMDIRELANKLAELSKDELAMSTGSQRF